ncbi:MAG TPA: hypothetical protein PKW66_19905, partial [Polyangiaceae bacterium]|nr:hypothetical protein [Polyangiaceae bacterium]
GYKAQRRIIANRIHELAASHIITTDQRQALDYKLAEHHVPYASQGMAQSTVDTILANNPLSLATPSTMAVLYAALAEVEAILDDIDHHNFVAVTSLTADYLDELARFNR